MDAGARGGLATAKVGGNLGIAQIVILPLDDRRTLLDRKCLDEALDLVQQIPGIDTRRIIRWITRNGVGPSVIELLLPAAFAPVA